MPKAAETSRWGMLMAYLLVLVTAAAAPLIYVACIAGRALQLKASSSPCRRAVTLGRKTCNCVLQLGVLQQCSVLQQRSVRVRV
jgi:hypothetical protein